MRHAALALLLLALARAAPAVTYAVDNQNPAADDANLGTERRPLRTISAAALMAGPGDTVLIRAGTYREEVALTVSGTKAKPITFRAAEPGSVVVTGADPLTEWKKEPGDSPAHSTPWAHDFVINTHQDGTKVRHHLADPPVGCAEMVVCDGRPLRQVTGRDDLAAGTFFVDRDGRHLLVHLPGGADPAGREVLAATRSRVFAPAKRGGEWSQVEHVRVVGLTFRHAANFAQRAMVRAGTGWALEDCAVEWANAGGLEVEGDDVTLLRVAARHNGQAGLTGRANDLLMKDCTIAHNNWKGFSPANEASVKFVGSSRVRVENLTSHDNVGPGLWFDWDNSDVTVTGCTIFANRGLEADWEGAGVFVEASQGPVRVTNNVIYGNTGAGVCVAESGDVTVEGNTVVGCGTGVELRAMAGRGRHGLERVTVRGNAIKSWRVAAVATSLGDWGAAAAADRKVAVAGNAYDPAGGSAVLFRWAGEDVKALGALDAKGEVKSIPFDKELVPARTVKALRQAGIDAAIKSAKPGDEITLPVNGRTGIEKSGGGWACQVYDLNNRHVRLTMADEAARRAVEALPAFPLTRQARVRVKLTKLDGSDVEAAVVRVEGEGAE